MNQENCEKIIQIINCTHTSKSTLLNNQNLKKLFSSAQAGNEMAFIYLAEWFFKHANQLEKPSAFENVLYENLKPYFER